MDTIHGDPWGVIISKCRARSSITVLTDRRTLLDIVNTLFPAGKPRTYTWAETSDVESFNQKELKQMNCQINSGESSGLNGVLNKIFKLIAK